MLFRSNEEVLKQASGVTTEDLVRIRQQVETKSGLIGRKVFCKKCGRYLINCECPKSGPELKPF